MSSLHGCVSTTQVRRRSVASAPRARTADLLVFPSAFFCIGFFVFFISGCVGTNTESDARLILEPGSSWEPVDRQTYLVPGTPLAAWSGPGPSALIVYRTLPVPQGSAETSRTELSNRLLNLPELEIVVDQLESHWDLEVARVEVVAPGSGTRIAPTGLGRPILDGVELIPTRRGEIILDQRGRRLHICWIYPESEHEQLGPLVEDLLRSSTLQTGRDGI